MKGFGTVIANGQGQGGITRIAQVTGEEPSDWQIGFDESYIGADATPGQLYEMTYDKAKKSYQLGAAQGYATGTVSADQQSIESLNVGKYPLHGNTAPSSLPIYTDPDTWPASGLPTYTSGATTTLAPGTSVTCSIIYDQSGTMIGIDSDFITAS